MSFIDPKIKNGNDTKAIKPPNTAPNNAIPGISSGKAVNNVPPRNNTAVETTINKPNCLAPSNTTLEDDLNKANGNDTKKINPANTVPNKKALPISTKSKI